VAGAACDSPIKDTLLVAGLSPPPPPPLAPPAARPALPPLGAGPHPTPADPAHTERTLADLAAACPLLREARRAAGAPRAMRFKLAISHMASAARVAFSAALLAAQALTTGHDARQATTLAGSIASGRAWYGVLRGLSALGPAALADAWLWTPLQTGLLRTHLTLLIGETPVSSCLLLPCAALPNICPHGRAVHRSPNGAGLFLAALAHGWPWRDSLRLFRGLLGGVVSLDGLAFVPDRPSSSSSARPLCDRASAATSPSEEACGFSQAAFGFRSPPEDAQPPCSAAEFPFGAGVATVYVIDGRIALVRTSTRMCPSFEATTRGCRMVQSCRPGRGPFPSLFAPAFIRMPCRPEGRASVVLPPIPDSGAVIDFRDNWERLVGPLSGEARAVVNGLMHYPRRSHAVRRSRKRNHPSFEDSPDAKRHLGPKVAAWIYWRILECCPPSHPPALIEPIGAVPKKGDPPVRMINDGRVGNLDMDKWPVDYTTPREAARSLGYGDFIAGSDFDDAYHACKKAGCTGRVWFERVVRVGPSGSACWGWQTRVGCSPESCSGTCDKARSGVDLGGLLARFASSHFGEAPAGSPLNALVMQLRRYFGTRGPFSGARRVATAAWVDDMLLILKNIFHGHCGGLAAGCAVCAENKSLADELEAHWLWLAPLLGFSLSVTKRQPAAQRAEYSGIIFDTILGLFLIPDGKRDKILADLASLLASETTTARDLARVAGRLLHYSICLRHVRPHIPFMWALIGSEDPRPDYDRVIPVTPPLRAVCDHLLSIVPAYAPAGAPLWPLVASSLYGRLCAGAPLLTRTFAVTCDSAAPGWGLGLQTPEHRAMRVFPQTWPAGTCCPEQVHREALGLCLALEAAAALEDLSGATVILRNDSTTALSALRKGSTDSQFLQDCAMRMSRFAAASDIDLLFLHVPGETLVVEGVDAASRSLAAAERGPACSPALRQLVASAASAHGWSLSIDLFACGENSLCERFYSRYPETSAAATDALSVGDWNSSTCPACGQQHREVVFAFPPSALIPAFMAKAAADGVRGIVLVPAAVTAPHWPALMQASLADRPGFERLRRPAKHLLTHLGSDPMPDLALFAVDFGDPRASFAPPCPGACARRPRAPRPAPAAGAGGLPVAARRLAAEIESRSLPAAPPPASPSHTSADACA